MVPKRTWAELAVSELVVTADMDTTACHGAALSHLGQDPWLHNCEPRRYLRTRTWASAIRDWAPDASGLIYRCRNNNDRLAAVLFGTTDHKVMPALRLQRTSPIDDLANMDLLTESLCSTTQFSPLDVSSRPEDLSGPALASAPATR